MKRSAGRGGLIKWLRAATIILFAAAFVLFVISCLNIIVFPVFNRIPFGVAVIAAALLGMQHMLTASSLGERIGLGLALPLILVLAFLGIAQFAEFLNPREGHFESTSPGGEKTIVVEYDFVSRPSVYRRWGGLFMRRIPMDFGPGYNETVRHEVVWLSETSLQLKDRFGDTWNIELPVS